jgi:ABC-type multidrug transport system fused ATPase/permease subunit
MISFSWLDATPTSRIIARCTQDMGVIDSSLYELLGVAVAIAVSMIVKLSGLVFFSPILLFPGILVSVVSAYLGNIYLKAQMSVQRETRYILPSCYFHFC